MAEINTDVFHSRLKTEIERVGLLSCKRILESDKHDFRKLGNFSDEDIERIKFAAARTLLPIGFKTAKESEELFQDRWRRISFDCDSLDSVLAGGIPVRGITEISGHSGAGKTQLCLQLSLTVQYPVAHGGLNRGAVYICTEDRFPSKRLYQTMKHFPRGRAVGELVSTSSFGDNIFVDHIADVEGLKECVSVRLKSLVSSRRVGLIVVDSIAGVFRGEYAVGESRERADDLRQVALSLHCLARKYNLAVVCTNQMSDAVDVGKSVAALGLAWGNLVTTRLRAEAGAGVGGRLLRVVSAPHLPQASARFLVTSRGLESPPDLPQPPLQLHSSTSSLSTLL